MSPDALFRHNKRRALGYLREKLQGDQPAVLNTTEARIPALRVAGGREARVKLGCRLPLLHAISER